MTTLNDPEVSGGPTLRDLDVEFSPSASRSVEVSYSIKATVNLLSGQHAAGCTLLYRPPGGSTVPIDPFSLDFSGSLNLLSFTQSATGKVGMIVPPGHLITLQSTGDGTVEFIFGREQAF